MAHTIAVPGLLGPEQQQRLERRRHVRHPQAVRGTRARPGAPADVGDRRPARAVPRRSQDALVVAFGAPPVDGLGSTGGFKLQVQDRPTPASRRSQGAVENVVRRRQRAARPGRPVQQLPRHAAAALRRHRPRQGEGAGRGAQRRLRHAAGLPRPAYVNDFTRFGRTWQVNVQADAAFRVRPEDIRQLKVRNADGEMVPLATLVDRARHRPARPSSTATTCSRRPRSPAAPRRASAPAGDRRSWRRSPSSELPPGMSFEWTELTLQQIQRRQHRACSCSSSARVLVFLVLAGQYESWSLPLAIILVVPMCLLAAIAGVWLRRLGQQHLHADRPRGAGRPGRQERHPDRRVRQAAPGAGQGRASRRPSRRAELRLRPILMTSFAFILGVVPLVLAEGAGAEMRFALGIAVFSGMLGVTLSASSSRRCSTR